MRLAAFVLIAVLGLGALPAGAATLTSGENVLLSQPSNDDVYVAGGEVIISSEIAGDLVAAGGVLFVNAPVAGDALVGGGNATFTAPIADDLRIAGGNVSVQANVGDDVLAGAGTLHITRDASIGGDLIVAGGVVIIDGTVGGAVKVLGGEVIVSGTLRGPASIVTDRAVLNGTFESLATLVTTELVVGDNASLTDVRYWNQKGTVDFGSHVSGKAFYDTTLEPQPYDPGFGISLLAIFIFSFFAEALVLLALQLLSKTFRPAVGEQLSHGYWKSFATGLIYFVVAPLAGLVLIGTLIGAPLGLILLAVYAFSLFAARATTAFVFTSWLERRRAKRWSAAANFFVALGGLVVLKLVALIPIVGWIALLLMLPAGVGAALQAKWIRFKQVR